MSKPNLDGMTPTQLIELGLTEEELAKKPGPPIGREASGVIDMQGMSPTRLIEAGLIAEEQMKSAGVK